MGGFAQRLHGVISHHTRCLPSGLGLLASTKAHMQAGENRAWGWGGLLPRSSAELQAGAETASCGTPALPGPTAPSILMAHVDVGVSIPARLFLQMAWKVVHRDELAKTGSKKVRSLLPCSRARVGAERKWLSREAICCPALSGHKGTRSTLEAINTEQLVDDFIAG